MKVSKEHKPPVGGMGGSIMDWERSLDPWHRNAFPDELAKFAPHQESKRREGWMALDWVENPICFIADGDEVS
jgi:hypothetical protein